MYKKTEYVSSHIHGLLKNKKNCWAHREQIGGCLRQGMRVGKMGEGHQKVSDKSQ